MSPRKLLLNLINEKKKFHVNFDKTDNLGKEREKWSSQGQLTPITYWNQLILARKETGVVRGELRSTERKPTCNDQGGVELPSLNSESYFKSTLPLCCYNRLHFIFDSLYFQQLLTLTLTPTDWVPSSRWLSTIHASIYNKMVTPFCKSTECCKWFFFIHRT